MGNRRFKQAPTSDDDDDDSPPLRRNQNKGKTVRFPDEEEEAAKQPKSNERSKKKKKKRSEEPEPETESENDEEQGDVEAQPIGDAVKVSGKGRGRRTHYESFEYNSNQYSLEDPALFHPENKNQKPYVAIIKDIAKTWQGELMVTGQWFYRPEEAQKKGGGNWQLCDTRELFYSFHRDEVPAESIFHKCVVHFIPLNKQIPRRQQHPGFIVQKVYDTEQKALFKLTDKDYEESKQHEIDLLVQKTLARLGDLPDLLPEETDLDHEDQLKNKRLLKRRILTLLDVSREDEGLTRSLSLKPETPGNTPANSSEYYSILSKSKQLTGETHRDKWLEKLLQSIQFICTSAGSKQNVGDEEVGIDKSGASNNKSHDKASNEDAVSFEWPHAAVPAIVDLEIAVHDAFAGDFQKYNQKLRQLAFNLKGNAALARRLLNRELEPAQILNMSPNELKEGLTAEEIASRVPEESGRLQMTDARCTRCKEKQVGLIDIIQTGHGDRYQLECVACGHTWYASRDDTAELTIEGPTSARTPSAIAKVEDADKSLVSPGGTEGGKETKESNNAPTLDNQISSIKTEDEEKPADKDAM